MSNPKKNQKKTPQAKAAAIEAKRKEKKKIDPKIIKTVLIAIAAVAVVAAVILLAIFVIKPAIEESRNKKPDNSVLTTAVDYDNESFETVEYNGLKLPEALANILKETEAERKTLCAKYGVAVEIGDIKISRPEFNVYYYEKCIDQYLKVQESIESRGQNYTGYNPDKKPEEQSYIRGEGTWADYFTYEAIKSIQETYADFYRACEAGTELEKEDMASLVSSFGQLLDMAEKKGLGPDEYLESLYFDGVDFSLFYERVIMETYAEKYRTDEKQRLFDSYSEEALFEKYNENPMKYKVAKVRVYMIEGEYNAVEAAAVNNEKEFLEYAENNYPYGEYDADIRTNMGWIAYSDLEAYHGETVAKWAFDEDRVPGEIGVVRDYIGNYLVLVEEPAFDSYTYQVLFYRNQYEDIENHQPELDAATAFFDEWKAGEQTEESFRTLAEKTGYLEDTSAIITRYDLYLADWFTDPARKYGDTFFFEASDAAYVCYYLRPNTEDLNWKQSVRKELREEDFKEQFDALIKDEYNTTINEAQMSQCYIDANKLVEKYMAVKGK